MPGRNTSSSIPISCPPQVLHSLKWHGRVTDLFRSSRLTANQVHLPFMANSSFLTHQLGTAGQTLPFSPLSFGPDLLQPARMWVRGPLSCKEGTLCYKALFRDDSARDTSTMMAALGLTGKLAVAPSSAVTSRWHVLPLQWSIHGNYYPNCLLEV